VQWKCHKCENVSDKDSWERREEDCDECSGTHFFVECPSCNHEYDLIYTDETELEEKQALT
jgi:Zn finger protein HypA/HybF involved in hydrogenase expression